jgi:hypothetical protein
MSSDSSSPYFSSSCITLILFTKKKLNTDHSSPNAQQVITTAVEAVKLMGAWQSLYGSAMTTTVSIQQLNFTRSYMYNYD